VAPSQVPIYSLKIFISQNRRLCSATSPLFQSNVNNTDSTKLRSPGPDSGDECQSLSDAPVTSEADISRGESDSIPFARIRPIKKAASVTQNENLETQFESSGSEPMARFGGGGSATGATATFSSTFAKSGGATKNNSEEGKRIWKIGEFAAVLCWILGISIALITRFC